MLTYQDIMPVISPLPLFPWITQLLWHDIVITYNGKIHLVEHTIPSNFYYDNE